MPTMCVLVAILVSTLAAASQAKPTTLERRAKVAIRDCAGNGRLDGQYSIRTLQRALRTLSADVRAYTACEDVIRRAIRRRRSGEPRGLDRVRAVIHDCAADNRLDRRFRRSTLERALRHLPTDVRRYTHCDRVIRAALERGR